MKAKKIIALCLTCLFGFAPLCACNSDKGPSGPETKPVNANYDPLGLNEIAIGIYITPDDAHREQKYFDYMVEAGINFVNGFRWYEDTDDEVMQCLNLAEKAGLPFLVNDKTVLDNIETYFQTKNAVLLESSMQQIQKYVDHPAYAGQFFIDEPYRDKLEDLAEFTNLYEQVFPGNYWNINMFSPNVSELGCTYEQFMDDYFALTNARVYSYDHYPLLQYDENDPYADGMDTGFYYGLDLVRSKTLERNIPFWTYIQAIGIGGADGILTKRDPSRNDIRWSEFINLAFGAKGLQYFTYFTPASGAETFTEGLIDANGEKTEHYEAAKEVNQEIKAFGNILLFSDAEGVIFNKQPSNNRYKLYTEPFESYGRVESTGGDTFVAGCFRHTSTGKQYLLITPHTPLDSAHVELNVTGSGAFEAYEHGQRTEVTAENGKVSFDIAAGDAVFIQV